LGAVVLQGLVWLGKPVVEVAQMLKRHLDNLLTYLKHHISNAKHAVHVRGRQRQL
jgi:hypothetical protein